MKNDLITNNIEISLNEIIKDSLERKNYEQLPTQYTYQKFNEDLEFIKIISLTYDREKKDTDIQLIDFQQFLSAISYFNGKFAYILESDENGVSLYLGGDKKFLKDTFEGIYGGSDIEFSSIELKNMDATKIMLGIPSLKKDSEKDFKQNLERIIYPLQGKKFRIAIVADALKKDDIDKIISNYRDLKDEIHKLAKQTKNLSETNSESLGESITITASKSNTITLTEGENYSKSDKTTKSKVATLAGGVLGAAIGSVIPGAGTAAGAALGASAGAIIAGLFGSEQETKGYSNSKSEGFTSSQSKSQNETKTTTTSKTVGVSFEEINSNAQYLEKLIDEYIKRYQQGLTNGMWRYALYIQANDDYTLHSLETMIKSVYSGKNSYFEPIRFTEKLSMDISKLPIIEFNANHIIHKSFASFTTPINTEELSIIASLPKEDIDGIKVSKISSYGLTTHTNNGVKLGKVLNKKKITEKNFFINKETLASHMFVSGITGSGKSNTIKLLLKNLYKEYKVPFLIIEPAKSEYKNLMNDIENLQYFAAGNDEIFKINPFIFDPNKTMLFKHIDMLKSAFNAAFPMYGSMPYLLEEAIIKIYEDRGWNIKTQTNKYLPKSKTISYESKFIIFPTMNDLLKKLEEIVKNAGYYQDLESNIKAALITRIKNLTIGTKGNIFNILYSLSDEDLFEKPTIIDLSNITNNEEKIFLMALILNKLYFYATNRDKDELAHITVIEEAHRLLPNIDLNSSMEEASSKAYGVETFTNILAEIRAFKEGLIIVDQIPSKLHPDVIKNTDTKIVHRLTAMDDREMIGKSINLNKNQILDLAELKVSEGVVYNRDLHKPFLVKINKYNEKKISSEKIEIFRKNYLNTHIQLKYKFLFEENFYNKKCQNESFDVSEKFINFLNMLFSKLYYKEWFEEIKQLTGECIIYAFVKEWEKLKFISNIKCYDSIEKYQKVYESFIDLLLALNENQEVDYFLERFLNNFKDYKLIIAENIYNNDNLQQDIKNLNLEEILNKYFGISNEQMIRNLSEVIKGKEIC